MRKRLRNCGKLLRRQDGISLVMAVGILGVLSLAGTSTIYYSSSNARSAEYSQENASAYDLAEAGINEILSILGKPENNALEVNLLPQTTRTYDAGSVTWSGTLNLSTATWAITSTGTIANPTGAVGDVTRTLTAKVPVTPTYTQPLNNPVWNYIFSTRTGTGGCDQTLNNNVGGGTRLYIAGNLCLSNNAAIDTSPLIVHGKLWLDQGQTRVGTAQNRVETYVGQGCKKGNNLPAVIHPCPGDSEEVYSKLAGSGNPGVNTNPPLMAAPVVDWLTWYEDSMPGPVTPCTSTNGASTGAVATFDNNGVRDNSVSTVYNLTPATSYTCRVGPARSPSGCAPPPAPEGSTECTSYPVGELSWNATTRLLTVYGTIYLDGSAYVGNGLVNQYNGVATIYLSGTLYVNGKLCGGVSGSACDFANWDPNKELLTFVAGQTSPGGTNKPAAGYSVELINNAEIQGGLYASAAILLGNTAKTDGPMVASYVTMSNNVVGSDFPIITTVPVGMPGNPAVYAQPNAPQLYSG